MDSKESHMGYPLVTCFPKEYAELGGTGVLGLECASGYWGLSTFPDDNLILLVPNSNIEIRAITNFIGIPREIDYSRVIEIYPRLYVTDKETTICDMIEYEAELRFTLESIENYLEDNEDLSKLMDDLKNRGLVEKFEELKEEIKDIWNY